jgi:RimJ/RimL family protein N-acetyltransferase
MIRPLDFPADFPGQLEGGGVRLERMERAHEAALRAAAADGELWRITYARVPEPAQTRGYIEQALAERAHGARWPFVVRDLGSGEIVGTTSYMEIVPDIRRVEIGGTWYGRRWQRTHVNTACKWLLLEHAFDQLQCTVVGWRTDVLNLASQAAIERLGAKKDGIFRRQRLRRDGTIRDAVFYSLLLEEWQADAKERLRRRLR